MKMLTSPLASETCSMLGNSAYVKSTSAIVDPLLVSIGTKSKISPVGCPRTQRDLTYTDAQGNVQIITVGCRRSDCPYCGRVSAYRTLRRTQQRLAYDLKTGIERRTRTLFVTFTLRAWAVSVGASFAICKPAVSAAIASARRERNGLRARNGFKQSWPGMEIEYISGVDTQPASGMAHIHVLMRVRPLSGKQLPKNKALRSVLRHYFNYSIYRQLELPLPPNFAGPRQMGGVWVENARNNEAVLRYILLNGGRPWQGDWQYPARYRRLTTSRGFLPPKYANYGQFQFIPIRIST